MKKMIFASLAACLLLGGAATSANAMTRAQWWALHHPYGYVAPAPVPYYSPMAINPYAYQTPVYPTYPRHYHHHIRIW
jgi:hypothetical protein